MPDAMTFGRVEEARAILRANDRGGYTVPTARLYPFQWNWDSAFVAMGWATFDEARAWRELERLAEGQWDDGMIPHIVFHAPSDDYYPGPEVWRTTHAPATSGITQPAVFATALRRVLASARERAAAEAHAARLYRAALASHRWWARARDPEASGLAALLHPWESGMDNSPAWDAALLRVPATTREPVRRKDTGHVDPDMRPSATFYARVIHLVELFADCDWDPARQWRRSPFKVADISANSILARAELDLLALAQRFGTPAERDEIAARAERQRRAITATWSAALGLFRSVDLVTGAPIDARCAAGMLPPYAGIGSAEQVAALAHSLARWALPGGRLVASTAPDAPGFEPQRYWRGPIWAIVNTMIAEGFARAGRAEEAQRIRSDTWALIEAGGFAEYFDPRDGRGLGGGRFSWTAAMYLLLAAEAG